MSQVSANTITPVEVVQLYNRFVAVLDNPIYLGKYNRLPMHLNTGYRWENHDFPRIPALLEFREWSEKYAHFATPIALVLNGRDDPEAQYIRADSIDYVDYDLQTNQYDLHTLNLPRKDYGFIMANQTLEHVYHPYLCVQNIFNHLRSGGYFYCNVPLLNIPHSVPFHYYTGYTAMGLLTLFRNMGFDILEYGQWGNFEYIQKLFAYHQWPDYRQLQRHGNEFRNAVAGWVLVKKP